MFNHVNTRDNIEVIMFKWDCFSVVKDERVEFWITTIQCSCTIINAFPVNIYTGY